MGGGHQQLDWASNCVLIVIRWWITHAQLLWRSEQQGGPASLTWENVSTISQLTGISRIAGKFWSCGVFCADVDEYSTWSWHSVIEGTSHGMECEPCRRTQCWHHLVIMHLIARH
jgi:hypothetical protein